MPQQKYPNTCFNLFSWKHEEMSWELGTSPGVHVFIDSLMCQEIFIENQLNLFVSKLIEPQLTLIS